MFTQLPSVAAAQLSDIICSVQAGVSVQETLQQVFNLFNTNLILHNAGNPNGAIGGVTYQLCWDTADSMLYVCNVSGNSATAVWVPAIGQLTNGQLIIGSTGAVPVKASLSAGSGISITGGAGTITISGTGSGIGWNEVTGTTQQMVADSGYVANNGGLVTFTLPATAAFGTAINIIGKGAGGWSIVANTGQTMQVGAVASTITTGSVSSTNQFDSIDLICTTANTVWTTHCAPQGNLTII